MIYAYKIYWKTYTDPGKTKVKKEGKSFLRIDLSSVDELIGCANYQIAQQELNEDIDLFEIVKVKKLTDYSEELTEYTLSKLGSKVKTTDTHYQLAEEINKIWAREPSAARKMEQLFISLCNKE